MPSDATALRVLAARQVSQEARMVLTSLRSGPPHVARGDLAQDFLDLREAIPRYLQADTFPPNSEHDPGALLRPFLSVIVDPRAAGPHTLLALRSVARLLPHWNVLNINLSSVLQHVLRCKFEQTDPAADEAVEMAIADVLLQLVQAHPLPTELLLDAFHTVFLTRSTFCHSQALCLHLDDVLQGVVEHVCATSVQSAAPLLQFLVQQMSLVDDLGAVDESVREATEDANRVLCLRLIRAAVAAAFYDDNSTPTQSALLPVIQDELCLSLLMTGQAIWAQSLVSLPVLAEICATWALLWDLLKAHLVVQFETIWTGFYTRALVLLRKRRPPTDSLQFNANLLFDAQVEIILESLVDILTLHNHKKSIAEGDGGALETIFCYYDCHMRRSDVAMGLLVELTRCCGGSVNPEGQLALTPSNSGIFEVAAAALETPATGENPATPPPSSVGTSATTTDVPSHHNNNNHLSVTQNEWRHVPAHLKELCAQAIMGAMKCLFRDDQASAETMLERSQRKRSILLRQVPAEEDSTHWLRDLKSKKRLMRKAAHIFNQKASRGLSFLVDSGLLVEPVTPKAVAQFLRNGIVVGLDKKAVGAYLGEAGKGPMAGKSPPSWERDWFHKQVLSDYCGLFKFEGQSLLDGGRLTAAVGCGGACPVRFQYMPRPCAESSWWIERTIASLSTCFARRGVCSPIWMPGTFVSMGRNSPRISRGALGLGSNVSW